MRRLPLVLLLVLTVGGTAACIQLGKSASSSGGNTVSAGCTKIKAYCKGDAGREGTCPANENSACAAEFEAEVDCLISNGSDCNAALELEDSLPACATQHATTATCVARNVDAGTSDGAVALPTICGRIKKYCGTTEAKDADCIASYNNAGRCLTQFQAAFNCFMDNKSGCNSAGELDDTNPACQTQLAAYVNCTP